MDYESEEICVVFERLARLFLNLAQGHLKSSVIFKFDPYMGKAFLLTHGCGGLRKPVGFDRDRCTCLPQTCGIAYYNYILRTYDYMKAQSILAFNCSSKIEIEFAANCDPDSLNPIVTVLDFGYTREGLYRWLRQVNFKLILRRDLRYFRVEFEGKPELNFRVEIGDRESNYHFLKIKENK